MNPLEWLEWVYGKWFLGHPYHGYFAVLATLTLLGAIALLPLWVRAVDRYHEQQGKQLPPVSSNAPDNSVLDRAASPPNLILHTYEAGATRWHNDQASAALCLIASIGNSGSPSNARSPSVAVELTDGSRLVGEITALSIPSWRIKDPRFGFDLTLRQEDALFDKAFTSPIENGQEVTGFILVKFPDVPPERLMSIRRFIIGFKDVRGREYVRIIDPQMFDPRRTFEGRHRYPGTRLNEPPS